MIDSNNDCLKVLFSSDDAYAQHMAAAIHSVLVNNIDFQEVCIYIVDNRISNENKEKLE